MGNLSLWDGVCKTNPAHTKIANVRGNKITAIAPQSQIYAATAQFGPYGSSWGFKNVSLDYSLSDQGLVVFQGLFYYPEGGEFPIISSISIYKDNAKTKIDDDFAKKVETDALTKALSKLGFNADVFMGLYDDNRYVSAMKEEFSAAPANPDVDLIMDNVAAGNVKWIHEQWSGIIKNNWSALSQETITQLNDMIKRVAA